MKTFELIVIGAGSGLNVAVNASKSGIKTALIEEGPMGGTCLNRGCIPSKILIHSADVAETVRNSKNYGIDSSIKSINFSSIIKYASDLVDEDAKNIELGIKKTKNLKFFKETAKFIGDMKIQVGKKVITGKKIVIAAGTRPSLPPIEGIEKIGITSDKALRLKKLPKTMTILGGGFIAAELAHFFGSLGTKITIVQRSKMLKEHDDDISNAFQKIFSKKYNLLLGYTGVKAYKKNKKSFLEAVDNKGNMKKISSDVLLIATGRTPNTDILEVENTGVKTNEKGFIKVNNYLETSKKNIWAFGDIIGKYMLKHIANLEASYVLENMFNDRKKVDYWPVPSAVFTSPQIASVGYREKDLKSYAKGYYAYSGTGMGAALKEKDGFVKVLADRRTKQILGCHIIGPDASSIIHEVIIAMKNKIKANEVARTVHIHPALPEVVQRAIGRIEW